MRTIRLYRLLKMISADLLLLLPFMTVSDLEQPGAGRERP